MLSKQEEAWLSSLQEDPGPEKISSAVGYALSPYYGDPQFLDLTLHKVRLRKDGFLGKSTSHYSLEVLEERFARTMARICQQQDWECLGPVWKSYYQGVFSIDAIKKIVNTGRCSFEADAWDHPLVWDQEKAGTLEWVSDEYGQRRIRLQTSSPELSLFMLKDSAFYINRLTFQCGLLRLPIEPSRALQLLRAPQLESRSLSSLAPTLSKMVPEIDVPQITYVELPAAPPQPVLILESAQKDWYYRDHLTASLAFKYGGEFELFFDDHRPSTATRAVKNTVYTIKRDIAAEEVAKNRLLREGWRGLSHPSHSFILQTNDSVAEANRAVLDLTPTLRKEGWMVRVGTRFPCQELFDEQRGYIHLFEGGHDWFDLELGTIVDNKRVNLVPAIKKAIEEFVARGVNFDNFSSDYPVRIEVEETGEWILWPGDRFKNLLGIFLDVLGKENGEKIRIPKTQLAILWELEANTRLKWEAPEQYRVIQNRFKEVSAVEKVSLPKGLQCTLRPYQVEGVSWLQFLSAFGLSGILADDMGLGKTVQAITHILIEKETGRMKAPVLIVAPTTLMDNWLNECQKFAPGLKVLILQGQRRHPQFEKIKEHDVILTTYPLLVRDLPVLLEREFHMLILDEAQNVKNEKTQAHKALSQIHATHRLCLTGTPMENHLGELWSLFHLLLPGFLGNERQFQTQFRRPIEKEGSLERKRILQTRIRPFMLRRTKEEVVLELPPKTEIIVPIDLTSHQQDLYEGVRLAMMEKVLAEVEKKGLKRSHIIVLDALLKLRQICCDPRLLEKGGGEDSAKVIYLRETLPQMIQEGRKILLFSQFASMLQLIEEELRALNLPYGIITGETGDRRTPVEAFQSAKMPILLLSLKAAGTGLNLTAADTVIHYDPWWNPAVESQATDRAYRIGQERPVFVYKLIASHSVEKKILKLQAKKQALLQDIFEASSASPFALDMGELRALFEPLHP
ncbi:MAG: DEAD/DEAH box helicase [Verrucomicrobia bacterium]|nr:DEAD/DEAH box helicase [Verrucomicrobiota bacterium]